MIQICSAGSNWGCNHLPPDLSHGLKLSIEPKADFPPQ